MKIKTITCHDVYNHGASLQAFALQHYLQSIGHDVEIIHYKPPYLSGHYDLWKVSNSRYDKPIIRLLYLMVKLPGRLKSLKRKRAFDAFTSQFLRLTRRYDTIEALRNDPPHADVYIAGSDQIWNTTFRNGLDPAFYLDFGPDATRRISYAASFATNSLTDGSESFVNSKLANFDSISVRESSALDLLNQLGYTGVQVVDPVFLLSPSQWDDVASINNNDKDYILVYDFMRDSDIRAVALRLAKHYSCKVISISPLNLDYAHKNYWDKSPIMFVSLIKNARCVISNSFHGTAFSMIYNRDFFVVNRKDGLNTRMKDLLSRYKIAERQISSDVVDDVLFSHINYNKANQIIEQDIQSSILWLKQNLVS